MRWRPSSTFREGLALVSHPIGVHRLWSRWQTEPMIGAVLMILLLVVVMPVGILMSGALAAALLGGILKKDADTTHDGSELLALSEIDPWADAAN